MRKTEKPNSTYKLSQYALLQQTAYKRHSPQLVRSIYNSVQQFESSNTHHINPKRKKIFTASSFKLEHIEIGSNTGNLLFQDLDQSIFSICFMSFKCGCQNSTNPCQRIVKNIPESSINQMKKKYENLKQIVTKSRVNYINKLDKFISALPLQFPQALIPSIETVVKLEDQINQQSFSLLVSVFIHVKIDYIAYWLYRQLLDSFFDQYRQMEQSLKFCIDTHSKTLKRCIVRNNIQIHQIIKDFCLSYGTSFVPMKFFGLFIELFNKIGRSYLVRLLFVLILFLYPKFSIHRNVYQLFKREKKNIPWERVLVAATDHRIY